MTYLIVLTHIFLDIIFSSWFEQGPNLVFKKEKCGRT